LQPSFPLPSSSFFSRVATPCGAAFHAAYLAFCCCLSAAFVLPADHNKQRQAQTQTEYKLLQAAY